MELSDYNFDLPDELIAQEPASHREESRMLAVDRTTEAFRDSEFLNLPTLLNSGDVLVLNNTRVFPARLFGTTDTGARAEIFLIQNIAGSTWEALARPARRLKAGKRVTFGDELRGYVVENLADGHLLIEFTFTGSFEDALARFGQTPLPPYIKRPEGARDDDRERYQTVYAKSSGAIAAPTAGLHFTPDVLNRVRDSGVTIAEVTLHVGYGTFEPVRVDDLSKHSVMPERFEISPETAEMLNAAKRDGRRIVAVGTTTTRTLESAVAKHGEFIAETGAADLTITPGYAFRAVDALLTNFHLPSSSLLILVSTFGGHKLIMDAYKHAVASRYRFYSYGDCMFIQ